MTSDQRSQEIEQFVTTWAIMAYKVPPKSRGFIQVAIDQTTEGYPFTARIIVHVPGANKDAHLTIVGEGKRMHIESIEYKRKSQPRKRPSSDPRVDHLKMVHGYTAQASSWSLKALEYLEEMLADIPEEENTLRQQLVQAQEQVQRAFHVNEQSQKVLKDLLVLAQERFQEKSEEP